MATKTEAASQVRTVLQAVKDRPAQPGGARMNEATTLAHVPNPLLNALGYCGIDDLEFEHCLPDGKTFLDYRLYVDGKARVAVEAKALEVGVTDREASQGVSYASILGDEWTVRTNARQWGESRVPSLNPALTRGLAVSLCRACAGRREARLSQGGSSGDPARPSMDLRSFVGPLAREGAA